MLTHVFKPRWVVLILVSGCVARGGGGVFSKLGGGGGWEGGVTNIRGVDFNYKAPSFYC